jgi:hypothetical protein
MGNTIHGHPLFNTAITVDIKMPAITGPALRVMDFFTKYPSRGHIRKLGTMNNHQVNGIQATAFQPLRIRQRSLKNIRVHCKENTRL